MMKIIVPGCVQSIASFFGRLNESRILAFVFGNHHNGAGAGGASRFTVDFEKNMRRRLIEDLLRCIQPETVKVEFFNPVGRIGDEEFADGCGIRSIEVDRFAPFILITAGEVVRGKFFQVIPVRTQVVVNDIENDAESHTMRPVNERQELIWCAVEMSRGKERSTVIAPTELAWKFG